MYCPHFGCWTCFVFGSCFFPFASLRARIFLHCFNVWHLSSPWRTQYILDLLISTCFFDLLLFPTSLVTVSCHFMDTPLISIIVSATVCVALPCIIRPVALWDLTKSPRPYIYNTCVSISHLFADLLSANKDYVLNAICTWNGDGNHHLNIS